MTYGPQITELDTPSISYVVEGGVDDGRRYTPDYHLLSDWTWMGEGCAELVHNRRCNRDFSYEQATTNGYLCFCQVFSETASE